jgi:hypothetical protein
VHQSELVTQDCPTNLNCYPVIIILKNKNHEMKNKMCAHWQRPRYPTNTTFEGQDSSICCAYERRDKVAYASALKLLKNYFTKPIIT